MLKTAQLKGHEQSTHERAYDKTLAWFYAYPDTDFTLNELMRDVGMAKTTAKTIVLGLEKIGFLTRQLLGKVWRLRANPQHEFFVTKKIPFNLQMVYESGILAWIATQFPGARAVVLFGSYRKGDDTEASDVDIAVELLDNKDLAITPVIVKRLGYRNDVTMNVHSFSRNKIDLNVFASIANGIVLQGFLEVRP